MQIHKWGEGPGQCGSAVCMSPCLWWSRDMCRSGGVRVDTDWCKHLGASEGIVQWFLDKEPSCPGKSSVRKNNSCPELKRCGISYLGQLFDRWSQSDSLEHLRENDTVDSSTQPSDPSSCLGGYGRGYHPDKPPYQDFRTQCQDPEPTLEITLRKKGNPAQPHMTH